MYPVLVKCAAREETRIPKFLPSAITLAAGLLITGIAALIVSKNVKLPSISLVELERHISLGVSDELTEQENGLYSSKDVIDGNVSGTILAKDEEIQEQALTTYWNGTGTVSFHVPECEPGNLVVLEFSAKTNCNSPVYAEVVCPVGQSFIVELDNVWNRYYVPFIAQAYGDDEVFAIHCWDSDGLNYKANIGDFTVVDYGKETLLSSLKTGRYLAEKFESETVTAEENPMWSNAFASDGKYLYNILGGTLYVYGSDKNSKSSVLKSGDLKSVGQLSTLGDTFDCRLYADKKKLVVFSKGDGAYFIDISKPSEPQLLSHYKMSGECRGGDIYGNYAYLCNSDKGIEVLDVRDYTNPKSISLIENEGRHYRNCMALGDYLYAVDPDSKTMDVFLIHSKDKIKLSTSVKLDGMGYGLAVKENWLYVATYGDSRYKGDGEGLMNPITGNGSGIEVYDITEPEKLKLVAREKTDGRMNDFPNSIWEVKVVEDKLLVSTMSAGLYIYDISNPSTPVREKVFRVKAQKGSAFYRELDPEKNIMPYRFEDETVGSALHSVVFGGVVYSSTNMGIYKTGFETKKDKKQ